jgi:hypothetical protein
MTGDAWEAAVDHYRELAASWRAKGRAKEADVMDDLVARITGSR